MKKELIRNIAFSSFAVFAIHASEAQGAGQSVIVNFLSQYGGQPFSSLITDSAGNLFGTTSQYAPLGGGTVFVISKTATGYVSTPQTLYGFQYCNQGNCSEGFYPVAGLKADSDGNLLGTTNVGSANNKSPRGEGMGTVFMLPKTKTGYGGLVTLYSFCSEPNCIDGSRPTSKLISDSSGTLFGTTSGELTTNGGTIFKISKTQKGYGALTTLHTFCLSDPGLCLGGAFPYGNLTLDANGNLIGTAAFGGRFAGGVIFRAENSASGYKTPLPIYNFCSLPRGCYVLW